MRTTPARAGITRTRDPPPYRGPDHPRSRGDHNGWHPHMNALVGPPPLARGSRAEAGAGDGVHRTTPARAGITCWSPTTSPQLPDHPRSRGDHTPPSTPRSAPTGPPPLARGSRVEDRGALAQNRTTPARAGITSGCRWRWPPTADHPRSRGDHCPARPGEARDDGPPPLARGSPRARGRWPSGVRTTPARAGITWPTSRRPCSRADHPRSRGDHGEGVVGVDVEGGPPPLARGSR